MGSECTILMNDNAGALHPTAGPEQMRALIREIGLEAEIVTTTSQNDMCEKIRGLVASGVKKVVVSGGDGTVACAVQEIAGTNTTLGILPQGTANNFAGALHLPQDLPSALRVIKDGTPRDIDLGRIDRRYFTEAAGVGLFADTLALYRVGPKKNFLKGLYATLHVLLNMKAHRLKLTIDGEVHTERAVMCTVANSYRMGDQLPVAPGAKLTDAKLDVVIVGDVKLNELLSYYRACRAQLHMNLPKVTTLQARSIRIEAFGAMNVHCDDQVIGTTPVAIDSEPGAIKIMVDRL